MNVTNIKWPRTNRPGAHGLTFTSDTHVWSVTVEWHGMGEPPQMEVVDTYGRRAILTHPATSGIGKKPVFKPFKGPVYIVKRKAKKAKR